MSSITELLGVKVMKDGEVIFVAQADREIGITLKRLDNELDSICLNRNQITSFIKISGAVRQYHESFSSLVRQIQSGKIVEAAVFRKYGNWRTVPSTRESTTYSMSYGFK